MISLGKYPLSFLPDTISTPGPKIDVIPSDHRDSLLSSSYCESPFYLFSPIFIILVQTSGAWLFCPGSSDYQHDGATTPSNAMVENNNEKCLV